jgi:hypothetical protein
MKKLSALIFLILPVILITLFVFKYGVDSPYMDQWFTPADQLVKLAKGQLTFADLMASHNESKPFFPRLFFIGLAYLFGWHPKLEMFFKVVLTCFICLGIYLISRQTLQNSNFNRLVLLGITNWLIFNPLQWENWLWGFQIILFIPITCIVFSILLLRSNWLPIFVLIGCGLLGTISTFSMANGVVIWVVMLPCILHYHYTKVGRGFWIPLVWIGWFAVIAFAFLKGMNVIAAENEIIDLSFTTVLVQLKTITLFFLSGLGAPFSFGNGLVSPFLGGLLLILSGLIIGYVAYRGVIRQDLPELNAFLP